MSGPYPRRLIGRSARIWCGQLATLLAFLGERLDDIGEGRSQAVGRILLRLSELTRSVVAANQQFAYRFIADRATGAR